MKLNPQLGMYLVTGDDHANQRRSKNLNRNGKYAPVWHQRCNKPGKSNDIKSCIGRYVILVIRIHNSITLIKLRCIYRIKEHDGIWVPRSACLTGWLPRGSTEESSYQYRTNRSLGTYSVSGNDHVTLWRFPNLLRNGNMPQCGIRCIVGLAEWPRRGSTEGSS